MSRKQAFRIYFVGDAGGLLTGRLMMRSETDSPFAATGRTEEQVLSQLEPLVEDALERTPALHDELLWTEEIQTATVNVEIRPEVTVGRRSVVGKGKIPIEITFAWAPLPGEKPGDPPSGFRVMLPRFGWSMVLEELSMVSDVLKSAIGIALSGESQRSVFEFREAAHEYVVPWLPKSRRRRRSRLVADDERFSALNEVAEDWVEMARSGKLGAHYGSASSERYAELAAADPMPSLLLVGPAGVGKTEWVRDFARHFAQAGGAAEGMKIWASSAERITAGMKYLGMWEQRCLDLVAELEGEGHYLYVDRASSLVQQRTGGSSIADLFQTAISENRISLIAECTEEEYEKIQIRAPLFNACVQIIRIEQMDRESTASLIEEVVERRNYSEPLHPDATRRLVRHLSLFRKDHAFPGKAILFLKWLEQRRQRSVVPGASESAGAVKPRSRLLDARDVDRLFCLYSGISEKLISDDELLAPEILALELAEGVVGQSEACLLAAKVLTRFKAGVGDPEKPMGSLLLVGPTGVGKTEMAKQLARFVFGSEERLVRLDMSEYMLESSVHRLLSDERGSESLAQRVSLQPLSVVLLDEIEKAHPVVFDALLGMLGEGRLTSANGRLVDFRMALVVMTSNLGTGVLRVGFGRSRGEEAAEAACSAVREHFRPEFFNRLDHVVPFAALGESDLRLIVDLELSKIRQRPGLRRRNLSLVATDEAKAHLAKVGWHPTYGARPLRRVIEERVMVPIAVELAHRPKQSGLTVFVDWTGEALTVNFGASLLGGGR